MRARLDAPIQQPIQPVRPLQLALVGVDFPYMLRYLILTQRKLSGSIDSKFTS